MHSKALLVTLVATLAGDVDGPSLAATIQNGVGPQQERCGTSRAKLAVTLTLFMLVLANWTTVARQTPGLILVAASWTWSA